MGVEAATWKGKRRACSSPHTEVIGKGNAAHKPNEALGRRARIDEVEKLVT